MIQCNAAEAMDRSLVKLYYLVMSLVIHAKPSGSRSTGAWLLTT
jgi:hypothetical protein